MWTMDAVALAFAIAAVAVGLLLAIGLALTGRRRPQHEPTGSSETALDIMLGTVGTNALWRFESRADDTITIDVFSHRALAAGRPLDWRHDLMTEPLMLPAGTTAELPTEPGADRYEAAVAWYVGHAPELQRDSRFLTVENP